MYTIDRDTVLTTELIIKYIQDFKVTRLIDFKIAEDYYNGNQAILNKTTTDASKPCNKLVCNYCADIVDNYLGYLVGLPISYVGEGDVSILSDILVANDVHSADNMLLENALIYGVGYSLNYMNEISEQKFKVLNPKEIIPIYSNDLDNTLLYIIRFYHTDNFDIRKMSVDVYDAESVRYFKSSNELMTIELIDEQEHYFNEVPFIEMKMPHEQPVFWKIITLQDAYNKLISAHTDDYEAFVNAYMVLKNVTADSDDISKMKVDRVLLLDEDSDASYLTKDEDSTTINALLDKINEQIQRVAKSPDFNSEKFLAQSGIAIRFKCAGMENNASRIEAAMKVALRRRIELLNTILELTSANVDITSMKISFTRNLPVNALEQAQMVNELRGVVSNKTLLSQLPFVTSVDDEMQQLEKESSTTLYDE